MPLCVYWRTLMARDWRFVGEVGSRERRSIDLCFWFDCYETTKHSFWFFWDLNGDEKSHSAFQKAQRCVEECSGSLHLLAAIHRFRRRRWPRHRIGHHLVSQSQSLLRTAKYRGSRQFQVRFITSQILNIDVNCYRWSIARIALTFIDP